MLLSILLLIKNKKNYYIHGILIFICFLTKQNVGVYFGIGMIIYVFLERKDVIQNVLKIAVPNLMLFGIFIFILYQCNILYDFYNFAIAGITDFAYSNIKLGMDILILFVEVIMCVFIIVISNSKKIGLNKNIKDNVKIISCIGMPFLLISYPIFNQYHIILSTLFIWIAFIYIIDRMLIKEILEERIVKIINTIVMIFIVILLMSKYINFCTKYDYVSAKTSPYYGSWTTNNTMDEIQIINQFIIDNEKEGIKTIILSSKSNLYMLPLQKNDREFDLPIQGNLGKQGEEGLIEKIKQKTNSKILIQTDEENIFWQESEKAREYIKNTYKKEGTIGDFDIYFIK